MYIGKAMRLVSTGAALAVVIYAHRSSALDACDTNSSMPPTLVEGELCDDVPGDGNSCRGRSFDVFENGTRYDYGVSLVSGDAAAGVLATGDARRTLRNDGEPCPEVRDFIPDGNFVDVFCDVLSPFSAAFYRIGADSE